MTDDWIPIFRDDARPTIIALCEGMLGGGVTIELVPAGGYALEDPYAIAVDGALRFRLRWASYLVTGDLLRRIRAFDRSVSDRALVEVGRGLRQLAMRMDAVERGGYD